MQQALELRTAQQITLTPQIVQAIRVLQLSAADLEHEIAETLANNPFLERVDPPPAGTPQSGTPADERAATSASEPATESASDEREPTAADAWLGTRPRAADDDRDLAHDSAAATSLRDHLVEQLAGARFKPHDRLLVQAVIEALDGDGYLRQSVDELQGALPEMHVEAKDLEIAIRYVQSLDPPGVAARSLAECLRLQLERLPADACADEPLRALALRVVDRHLDLLALHDAALLARELQCDEDSIRRANQLIRRLDPRPGVAFGGDPARYVVADVIVKRVGGRWIATINPQAVPELRVNRALADVVRNGGAVPESFARYLQEARWMVRNVQQRFETIRRVAQAIVDRQKLYFELGELALRPLVLRDVAHELGLHPSTVSRVACNKYAQTPTGLIELKRFFTNRASHGQGAANVSSTAIRALIRKLVAAEEPQAPLSDVQITHLLASRGIKVARRTVAKYRDAIGVPPVESRRMTGGANAHAASARPIAALASERRARRQAQPAASVSPSLPYSFRRL